MRRMAWRSFVVLQHEWNGVHWDLMLDRGEGLSTWAVDEPIRPDRDLPARQLPVHRRFYLRYEGEVSGGRGVVHRWDQGVYRELLWTDDRVEIEIRGDHLEGTLLLERGVVSASSASAGLTDSTGGSSSSTIPWRLRLRSVD